MLWLPEVFGAVTPGNSRKPQQALQSQDIFTCAHMMHALRLAGACKQTVYRSQWCTHPYMGLGRPSCCKRSRCLQWAAGAGAGVCGG